MNKEEATKILKLMFELVLKTINIEANNKFNVIENIDYYYKNHYMNNNCYLDNFINLLSEKNSIILPIKIVNVNINNSYIEDFNILNVEKRINAELLKYGFKSDLAVFTFSLKRNFQIDNYYLSTLKIKNIQNLNDFVVLSLDSSKISVLSEFKTIILDNFNEYLDQTNTFNSLQESIIKSNPKYHKLINDRKKFSDKLSRLQDAFNEVDDEIKNIEYNILNEELVSNFYNEYTNVKNNCFNNLWNSIKDDSSSQSITEESNELYPASVDPFEDSNDVYVKKRKESVDLIKDHISQINKRYSGKLGPSGHVKWIPPVSDFITNKYGTTTSNISINSYINENPIQHEDLVWNPSPSEELPL
jgi:transposase-like protein